MNSSDKAYLNTILKKIFEKSEGKNSSGGKELELFIKHRINAYKINESLETIIENIKTEMLDNRTFKQYILHGNLKIFEILFYIINSYNINDRIYFNVLVVLLKFLSEKNENDKVLLTSTASTIIKLIRGKRKLCIVYFEHLFESLIFLYLHSEKEVRNYGYALDELLKDEVSNLFLEDYSTSNNNILKNSNIIKNQDDENLKFPIMYMLGKWEESAHPALKILIISWIAFLESISEIKMINYMNKIIPELFNLLCFKTKDVYQSSEFCLKKILCDIETQYDSLSCDYPNIIFEIIETIILNCNKSDEKIKLVAFEWLEMFLKKFKSILESSKTENDEQKLNELLYQNTTENNFIKGTIIPQTKFLKLKSKDLKEVNNYRLLREINHKNTKLLLKLGLMEKNEKKRKLSTELLINNIPNKLFNDILNAIINNVMENSKNPSINELIDHCNKIFKYIISKYPSKLLENNLPDIEKLFISYLSKKLTEEAIFIILEWTNQLYNQFETKLFQNEEEFIEKLINLIPSFNRNTLAKIMNTLCLICDKQPSFINNIINLIIDIFSKEQNLINLYGIKVLKSLSKNIDIFTIFRIICDNLLNNKNIFFVIKITKTLNMFLLAEKECQNIRNELSKKRKISTNIINDKENKSNNKDDNLFEKLFYLWALNPFNAVLLTMYCNYFELSYYLTLELSKIKLQENDYIELCQIVQIIESSIFNNIRIKLINPKKNIFLVKTLYALLMMLPQSNSFDALNIRIRSVKAISKLEDEDDDDDDDFIDNKNNIDNEISEENKKIIIDKYVSILKERYKLKLEYEKSKKM